VILCRRAHIPSPSFPFFGFQSDANDSDVKIADFGFAKRVEKPKSLTTQCGTPGYVNTRIQSER
jgi:hypothetical protein